VAAGDLNGELLPGRRLVGVVGDVQHVVALQGIAYYMRLNAMKRASSVAISGLPP
jgi:hypothetical protein